jgi:hypothetical protein
MRILKYIWNYDYLPQPTYDKTDPNYWIVTAPAAFVPLRIGQNDVSDPIYLFGVVPSDKDTAVDDWYDSLTPEQKENMWIKTRSEFDTESVGWMQSCMPYDTPGTSWQIMQEFVDGIT